MGEDDKKIVYLSNINSCSLPQTPKLEDQQNQGPPNVSNLLLEKSQRTTTGFAEYPLKEHYILEQLEHRLANAQGGSNLKGYNFSQSSSLDDRFRADEDAGTPRYNPDAYERTSSPTEQSVI